MHHRIYHRATYLSFLSIVLSTSVLFPQVKIKERVEINPKAIDQQTNRISSDGANVLTFRRGGTPWFQLIFPDSTTKCLMNGKDVPNGKHVPAMKVGTYPQWSEIPFTLVDPGAGITYVGTDFSDMFIGGAGGNDAVLQFAFPESPYWTAIAYLLELDPDSSEAMPVDWYLNADWGPGNPYDSTLAESINIPFEMKYRIIIDAVKPTAHDQLVMLSPEYQSLIGDVSTQTGDTIIVGPFDEGDELKLAIVSGAGTLLKGNTMFPRVLEYTGPSWRLDFEDWTDLDFSDLRVWVEPAEGNPTHLELRSESEIVYYGDTVDVEITPADVDSVFAPLGSDSDYEFSVELIRGTDQYGELLYQGDNGTFFEHIPSEGGVGVGVKFAANKLEPDSSVDLWFHLTATYIGGGGGASKVVGTGSHSGPVIQKAMREKKVLATRVPHKNSETVTAARKNVPDAAKFVNPQIAARMQARGLSTNKTLVSESATTSVKGQAVNEANTASSVRPTGEATVQTIPFIEFLETNWRLGNPEEREGQPMLVVNVPTEDQYISGDNPPKMPKPHVIAQLKNYIEGPVYFSWKLTLKWTLGRGGWHTPRFEDGSYLGDALSVNGNFADLGIGRFLSAYGMRGGNMTDLHIEATAGGKTYKTDISNLFVIKGENPTLAVMLSELNGYVYEAVAYQESRFNQFAPDANIQNRTEPDYPLQGHDPDDFGIMQKNKPSDDDIIWNWVTNVRTCKAYLDNRRSAARRYHQDVNGAVALDADQQLVEAYSEYNGGPARLYWSWVIPNPNEDEPGGWIRDDDIDGMDQRWIDAREYAETVFGLYQHHPWR